MPSPRGVQPCLRSSGSCNTQRCPRGSMPSMRRSGSSMACESRPLRRFAVSHPCLCPVLLRIAKPLLAGSEPCRRESLCHTAAPFESLPSLVAAVTCAGLQRITLAMLRQSRPSYAGAVRFFSLRFTAVPVLLGSGLCFAAASRNEASPCRSSAKRGCALPLPIRARPVFALAMLSGWPHFNAAAARP